MIQRIQSIYILIVAALFGSLFFIPISKLVIENEIVTLNLQQLSIQSATQSETIQTLFPTLTLAILIIILAINY